VRSGGQTSPVLELELAGWTRVAPRVGSGVALRGARRRSVVATEEKGDRERGPERAREGREHDLSGYRLGNVAAIVSYFRCRALRPSSPRVG